MDIKIALNTRRVVILSMAFILFGVAVFFIGMVVGAKARPPEVPVPMASATASVAGLADKVPQKLPELEKPSVEGVVAGLPVPLDKEKLAIPEVDIKKEAMDKLAVPEIDAKKAAADKLTVPDLDVKKEAAALAPPALKGKAVADSKTDPGSAPAPAIKEIDKKAEKPDAASSEKKPVVAESKKEAKAPTAGEDVTAQKSSASFTVQVGAFLEKTNAEVMLQDLRNKGYTPYIHVVWDDMKRQWHTVRLGNYEDQESASKSAADFTKKERIPTSVRGVGVL